ncbi:MAG: DUF4389 domain-containing protein [Gemmatimonadota bacterium]
MTERRNRLTTAFRIILAIPHLILVGGPLGAALSWSASQPGEDGSASAGGGGGGLIGLAATVAAVISWFAIVFTGKQPEGLRGFCEFYIRWRVRAVAYTTLLRDEYPPFGEGDYPAEFEVDLPTLPRNRLTVGFRLLLAIPHILAVWFLGIGWFFTSIAAWFAILFTGNYPRGIYDYGVGVLRWNSRLEGYLLLLYDDYPPFFLR